jgi:hypothetical protein
MLGHAQVRDLINDVGSWPGYPLKRHSDASHPIHKLGILADFGVCDSDPGVSTGLQAVLAHQSPDGAFETLIQLPRRFGGTDEGSWAWMACDGPVLLYALLAMGLATDERVRPAVGHLKDLVDENGWRCTVSSDLGTFRGPGRRGDPCPIANVYALKALSQATELLDGAAAHVGAEMLLWHWQHQRERKMYLFGIGTDFRKLKYPYVWYNILHVADVLSRFPFVRDDTRLRAMTDIIAAQADEKGRYTATSMYRAWKGWSFADKKSPSPWLTFLVLRILKRLHG